MIKKDFYYFKKSLLNGIIVSLNTLEIIKWVLAQ